MRADTEPHMQDVLLKSLGLDPVWKEVLARGYKIVRLIGKGGSGTVIQARKRGTIDFVAIKHLKVEKARQYKLVRVLREIEIMKFLAKSPMSSYFPELKHIFACKDEVNDAVKNVFLVMTLGGENLREHMKASEVTLESVKAMLYNTLCAFKALHSANIVQRDVKSLNLLVGSKGDVMVCDFGLARTLPESVRGKHNGQSSKVRYSVLSKVPKG